MPCKFKWRRRSVPLLLKINVSDFVLPLPNSTGRPVMEQLIMMMIIVIIVCTDDRYLLYLKVHMCT